MALSSFKKGSPRAVVLLILALLNTATVEVNAKPCDPTDPLGHNPENLCPTYPLPSVNSNTFTQGIGEPIALHRLFKTPQDGFSIKQVATGRTSKRGEISAQSETARGKRSSLKTRTESGDNLIFNSWNQDELLAKVVTFKP